MLTKEYIYDKLNELGAIEKVYISGIEIVEHPLDSGKDYLLYILHKTKK